ncbi:hypothetical protein [Streptomyces sp. NBC_01304]|uniref:hypothetical protein n=1 Tax=Streptomyces sp. NBC_01304 TaxID=2903818 RepID=UPI002E155B1C|nr:hypothetical protein OG430_39525 [Streptomyces sp. NBC_01304]
MDTGLPQASVGSKVFDGLLGFLPEWIQITFIALVLLAVVASWVVKIKRRLDLRRAARNGQPMHAAARYGQGQGADHLGKYAPRQDPANGQPQPRQQAQD